jgi:hypothetical protein
MTRSEVLTRLCKLSDRVGDYFRNDYPRDCFCGEDVYASPGYAFAPEVLEFIERAVEAAMEPREDRKP